MAIIVAQVVKQLKDEPSLRGPEGPPGKEAQVDYDQLAAEVIKRLPRRRVVVADGATMSIVDDETYAIDEAIVIDVQAIRNASP